MDERVYDMRKAYPGEPLRILLDDYDLTTCKSEEIIVKQLWQEGKSILDIAEVIRPTIRGGTETFILVLDMLDNGKLQPRKGGVWGNVG